MKGFRFLTRHPWLGWLLACGWLATGAGASEPPSSGAKPAAASSSAGERLATQVLPLLRTKCFGCHGDDPKEIKGDLDLRSRAGMLAGGESGEPAVLPGKPAESLLYQAINWDGLEMPPKANDRLTAEQIDLIGRWIAAGAPWPEKKSKPPPKDAGQSWSTAGGQGVQVPTSGGLSPDWTSRRYKPEDIWAYRPIQRPAVPAIAGAPHPVDAFLLRKLQERQLAPAGPADRRTWIRRATLDLTGLLPRPEEVQSFLADQSPGACERVIDRLLASPHYGEQQARHWLDVARYADTAGFSNDFERPNAWRYRDWVIRSFNQDKPFDRFIIEQLAGDELDPDSPEMVIATGFLRMGPWEHTGMSVAAVTRQQYLDDVTQSVGVTFLGQSLRCAKCHDHKFDPVPTRDYYRIQAVFAPVQFADRPVPYQGWENTSSFAEGRRRTRQQLQRTTAYLEQLAEKNQRAIADYLRQRGVKNLNDLPPDQRPKQRMFGLTKLELSLQKIYQKRQRYYERQLRRYEPFAFSVYNGPLRVVASNRQAGFPLPPPEQRRGKAQEIFILKGGGLDAPLEKVSPGVLSAVYGSHDEAEPRAWHTIPNTLEGRRLALARWITSPRNTLTARVIVNRIWQQHFGRGIVATPNNFGVKGAKPTHPELLDWLATWFVDHGWSIKSLHRLIMTSEAYRRSSDHPQMEEVQQRDPKNELLAYYRPRRMAAEELRDSILLATGELNDEMGGPGVFPEINWEVALQPRQIMGSVAPAYQPSPRPEQRNRRTIYAFRYRTLPDPLLEVFNRPGADISCPVRDETTVAPQAFTLLNSQFSHDRALALACRLTKERRTLDEQIERAFQLLLARPPSPRERQLCRRHVEQMIVHHRAHKPPVVQPPTKVTRQMVEELTGEQYSWTEQLELMKQYIPDRKPWQAGLQQRALAELCLVLLNSNEFVYIR